LTGRDGGKGRLYFALFGGAGLMMVHQPAGGLGQSENIRQVAGRVLPYRYLAGTGV
jgi:hypothetical protein